MSLRAYLGRHRMPVVFGPSTSPRQGPNGESYDYSRAPRTTSTVRFLTDAARLSRLLPPLCALDGEPIVTVEHVELRELEWLAGRGYNMLGVKFPVAYVGPRESLRGSFLSVLWEDRPEPILSGREELGFAKLFCELPPARVLNGRTTRSAVWDGHEFVRMTLDDLAPAQEPPQPDASFAGVLHHRFVPSLRGDDPDVEEMVMTPAGGAQVHYGSVRRGRGQVEFRRSSWEQLPTMFQVVNALADLPVLEELGGSLIESIGGKDLSDQRVLG